MEAPETMISRLAHRAVMSGTATNSTAQQQGKACRFGTHGQNAVTGVGAP